MTRRHWVSMCAGWVAGGAIFWLYHLGLVPFWAPMLASFGVTFVILEVSR